MLVVLREISAAAADAVRAGRAPDGMRTAPDYPTEFSVEVAQRVGLSPGLGPFFVCRAEDGVVVGEIGGSLVGGGRLETGYAIVASCWGRGYATDALRALVGLARSLPEIERVTATAPLDRPGSGRVLQKAGFVAGDEFDHEHDGVPMRVRRWELSL